MAYALPPPTGSNPSGEPPPGNVPGWRQVFLDDFPIDVPEGSWTGCDSSSGTCSGLPPGVREKWFSYPDGWKDTSKLGTYSPSQVNSIADSCLHLRMRSEGGQIKVAAPMPLLPGGNDVLYGRYAIRWKADSVSGYKVAWLLWPDSEVWPRDGEIDFPEAGLDGTVEGFMHRQNGISGGDQDHAGSSVRFGDGRWHTAVTEWLPGSVRFILDGTEIGHFTNRVPNTPMHWVIQCETGLGSAKPGPESVASIWIDWVAVWRPEGC